MNATSYTVDSATQITAVIPAGTAGTLVDITVTTPGRYVAPRRGGHVPVRRDHRVAEYRRPQPQQRPRRGRHHGDDLRNQLHRLTMPLWRCSLVP